MYSPFALVTTLRLKPVPVFTSVTVAPGTTAPVESFTIPRIVPVTAWAPAGGGARQHRMANPSRVAARPLVEARSAHIVSFDVTRRVPSWNHSGLSWSDQSSRGPPGPAPMTRVDGADQVGKN